MEMMVFCGLLLAVFVYAMIRGSVEEKRNKKRYRENLKKNYGQFPQREYETEQWENITRYFAHKQDEYYLDDITWDDLDMDSIYQLMDHTQSSSGAEYLYAMLRTPKQTKEDFGALETDITYLMAQEEERLNLQMLLHELGSTGRFSLYDYIDYLDSLGKKNNLKHYLGIIALAVSVVLIFVSASVGVMLLICVACYNIATYLKEKGQVQPYVTSFSYIMRLLDCTEGILKQNMTGMSEYKQELQVTQKAFRDFKKKSKMAFQMNGGATGNPMEICMDYVKMLLHIDLISFNNTLNLVQDKKEQILQMCEKVGYLDAVISIGAFRKSLAYYCVPQFEDVNQETSFTVTEGYHPAIVGAVANSFSQKKGMLITGSNASGKSTFLKMTAINAVLAQTIGTCAAKEYRAPLFQIYSSMSLRDNLSGGESYYIVEIKALKRIMDVAEQLHQRQVNPLLCFVDEVLRGTNTVERIAASTQVLKRLAQKNIYCFAATHDIELTHLLERDYGNYHFEEEVKDGDVLFSYHLLEGRAHTRNAIKLLQVIGFSKDIIQEADDMAQQFLTTGEWK